MYRRQVDPKICRLWAKLNDTRIQVRTGVGTSDKAEIGIVIGQGTMGGALASQAWTTGYTGSSTAARRSCSMGQWLCLLLSSKMIFWKAHLELWKQDQLISG